MTYPDHDNRSEYDDFTVAVAAVLAQRKGLDLETLRNFGEEPTTGNNKLDFLRAARYYTEAFDGGRLTPVEIATVWLSLQA